MFLSLFIFLFSLVCIVGLFGLKYWELRRGTVLFPDARARFDARAHHLKELMVAARLDLAKLVPETVRLGRILVHKGALTFASLARISERGAHQLADMVSYKHRFEKRETRSEFLKKVAERKSLKTEETTTEETTSLFADRENI